jgi:hypothetical protein
MGNFTKRTRFGGAFGLGGEVCAKSGGGEGDFAKRSRFGGAFGCGDEAGA